MNYIDLKGIITIFTGTLPLLAVLIFNLLDVKSIKVEIIDIKKDIASIRERLATLEERDRIKLR